METLSQAGFLTSHEVASRYRVDHTTVLAWIRKRRLRALRIGGGYRIRPRDLEAFEAAGDNGAGVVAVSASEVS